jgi:hypothetical protein
MLAAAQSLIAYKLSGQRRTLQQLLLTHPAARRPITRASQRLALAGQNAREVPDCASLRGVEGAAARE